MQKYSTNSRWSPSLTRKGDIFVEAGRLAAEYLVSQGVLPPGVLTGNRTARPSIRRMPPADRQTRSPPPVTTVDADASPDLPPPATMIDSEATPVSEEPKIPTQQQESKPESSSKEKVPIEVIDLEDDGAEQHETQASETEVFSDDPLQLFPTTTSSTAAGEDGYGLMISELLHPDEMSNQDEDSIYMSLGEIPLTYLRPWEQPPPPEYEKPFGDA